MIVSERVIWYNNHGFNARVSEYTTCYGGCSGTLFLSVYWWQYTGQSRDMQAEQHNAKLWGQKHPEKEEVDCHASDVRGNYIIIQHSEHEYSTIAHIKKDSFCVKVGDKVYRGQQIARCGNSGNTSEPHIHFQVQQGKSFLLSASLPIWFEKIRNHSISHNSPHISRGDIVENQNK